MPTLSGSGSRASLLSPAIDLATHVADVIECLDRLDDETLVLVGHSYAGMVLPGVADARAHRVSAAVFVDAFYPRDGEAAIDRLPAPFQEYFREQARTLGDGWRLPANDGLLDVWGLREEADRSWVRARLTDWSLRCFESPSVAPARQIAALPRWYVGGTNDYPARAAFADIGEAAAADGCTFVGVASGHDVMIEAPESLASVVIDALEAS
jgi:pimeloyl-ACP methyl ester carboxylesterase